VKTKERENVRRGVDNEVEEFGSDKLFNDISLWGPCKKTSVNFPKKIKQKVDVFFQGPISV
jgi:hypothetical protein